MKFPRNLRLIQGRFDVAPYVTVVFLLLMFLLLGGRVYTPGLNLQLPTADNLPGTDKPTVNVAVDANGRFYFQNQLATEADLKSSLSDAVRKSSEPLTLVVQADKDVSCENLVRLTLLARDAGIHDALLATLPRIWDTPSPLP